MSQKNTIRLLITSMFLLVAPAVVSVQLGAKSIHEIPTAMKVMSLMAMAGFAVLFYFYMIIPLWTWIKRWINGE